MDFNKTLYAYRGTTGLQNEWSFIVSRSFIVEIHNSKVEVAKHLDSFVPNCINAPLNACVDQTKRKSHITLVVRLI